MLFSTALVLSLSVIASSSAADTEDGEPRWTKDGEGPAPLRFVDRPLTLRRDKFAVFGDAELGAFSPDRPAVSLGLGSAYGIDDNLEIGLILLRLVMSAEPGTGLGDPLVFLRYRVLRGTLELAGGLQTSVPVSGVYELGARADVMLRLFSFARLDISPVLAATARQGWVLGAAGPAELRVQLGDHFSLGALAIFSMPDLKKPDVLYRLGGRAVYTVGEGRAASADLGVVVTGPDRALHGTAPEDPALGNYVSVLLEARFFMNNPNEPSPAGWNDF